MPKQLTAADHIQAAIAGIEAEINTLEKEGVRPGCLVESVASKKYAQWHWCHGTTRKYIAKKNIQACQAEIDRFKIVATLRAKIDLLNQAL
jgi:hydroxymethylpyrimidine/phosphomethylpyrimidine kinase